MGAAFAGGTSAARRSKRAGSSTQQRENASREWTPRTSGHRVAKVLQASSRARSPAGSAPGPTWLSRSSTGRPTHARISISGCT